MSSNMKWFWLPILATLLTACGGSSNNSNRDREAQSAATVKIVPASARAPLLSVLVDLDKEDDEEGSRLTALSLGQVAIFNVPVGDAEFTVGYSMPKGASSGRDYPQAIAPFDLDFEEDNRYEIFVGGEYPDLEYWVSTAPLAFDEAETRARLTLTNASVTLQAFDVHLTAVGAAPDSSTLLASLSYKETDHSVRVEKGDYQVKVTEPGSYTPVYTSPTLSLDVGSDITLVAIDNAWVKQGLTTKPPIVLSHYGKTGNSRLMFSTDSGADLRAVNASPDAGPLDILLDENTEVLYAEDLMLGQVTPYTAEDSGVHRFRVMPANGTSAVIDTNFNLVNGVSWTVYLLRPWENMDPLFVGENARPMGGHSRLRFVHGSSVAGTVNVYITEQGADLGERGDDGALVHSPVGTGLQLRGATGLLPIAHGTYDVTFTRTVPDGETAPATPEVIYGPVTVTLASGGVYTMLIRDEADMTVTNDWLDEYPEPAE